MFLSFEQLEKALIKKVPRISVIARKVRRERRRSQRHLDKMTVKKPLVTETSSFSGSIDLTKEEDEDEFLSERSADNFDTSSVSSKLSFIEKI